MKALRYFLHVSSLWLVWNLSSAGVALSQSAEYPSRPVTIISEAAPGSSPDIVARVIAEGLTKLWGEQVIVINQPGGAGSIAAHTASQAAGDGYTLFIPSLSNFASLPSAAPNLPLQLPRDFLPVGFTIEIPMFVAVNPSLGINTLPELISRAKKEPNSLSIAVTGIGRLTHLTALLLQQRAGIDILIVPYTGGATAAMADVVTNRVPMIVEGYSAIKGAVDAGQIKIIAQTSAKRLPQFPDLPTAAETLPEFYATGWQALVAPIGTPRPIIDKISADLVTVLSDSELNRRLSQIGLYPRPMNSGQTLVFINKQQETWLPILKQITAK